MLLYQIPKNVEAALELGAGWSLRHMLESSHGHGWTFKSDSAEGSKEKGRTVQKASIFLEAP